MPVSDQGNLNNQYYLIPRTLTFLFQEDYVLLIKGAPDKRLWPDLYNGIGGHIKRGEDIISSARRELVEETSIEPVNLRLVGSITIDTGEKIGVGIYVFRGECMHRTSFRSDEGATEWIHISNVQDYPLVEDLKTILPLVIESDQKKRPFSALYQYTDDGKMVISIN